MKQELYVKRQSGAGVVVEGRGVVLGRRVRNYLLCLGMAGMLLTVPAGAQESPAVSSPVGPANAALQYATITGGENNILVTRVPVVKANKQVVYEDISLAFDFSVDSGGTLTLRTTPTVNPSPNLITSDFLGGNYVGPSTVESGNALITVSGPGVVVGGATEWSIAASAGASGCTYPSTATFYVGPITNNPLYTRLHAAGITSTAPTAYSYGIIGDGPTCFPGADWYAGSLIGLTQNNGTLTIVSFTSDGNQDNDVPIDQITYTVKP